MLPAIEQLADTVLRQPVRVVVGEKNAAAETVEQSLVFVGREDGKVLALRQMIKQGVPPPVLVFVQSKERAVQLFHQLVLDGLRVDVIHADRTQVRKPSHCFRRLSFASPSSHPTPAPSLGWVEGGCDSRKHDVGALSPPSVFIALLSPPPWTGCAWN
jgi:hypothetical protein